LVEGGMFVVHFDISGLLLGIEDVFQTLQFDNYVGVSNVGFRYIEASGFDDSKMERNATMSGGGIVIRSSVIVDSSVVVVRSVSSMDRRGSSGLDDGSFGNDIPFDHRWLGQNRLDGRGLEWHFSSNDWSNNGIVGKIVVHSFGSDSKIFHGEGFVEENGGFDDLLVDRLSLFDDGGNDGLLVQYRLHFLNDGTTDFLLNDGGFLNCLGLEGGIFGR